MPPAVKCQDHYYPNEHEMNMVVMLSLQQMVYTWFTKKQDRLESRKIGQKIL